MKLVAAAVIRREDGRVLVVRRAPGEKLAGKWEFPGGKVEEGETLDACLRRELREELGVEAVVSHEVGTSDYFYEHGAIRLIALETRLTQGKLRLSVHDKLDWLLPHEIASLDMAPADIPIIDKL